MAIGINDSLNITFAHVERVANITRPEEFFLRVNHYVFSDSLYFIMLWVFAIILFFVLQKSAENRDQIINNMLLSFGLTAVISLFMRAISMPIDGVVVSMLTDKQMWVFPVLTLVCAGVAWWTKRT